MDEVVGLELHVKICLKDLIFVQRVDTDVSDSTGAEAFIYTPGVAISEVKDDRVA